MEEILCVFDRGVRTLISEFKTGLDAGVDDYSVKPCDLSFHQKHCALKAEVVSCVEDFQNLKGEIFNYAGGILKKKEAERIRESWR